ncbi:hypothetical protein CCACVL1_12447 [Corchorus capsularis]|uniref:Uncharacterized protein n=1 Tax=Corchorus capsularis TaxID=210143 RepID=A0A1R3IFI6_COCAP|nr:hypothetical protein CCACVL1_12447 [Corchorus capsularis]
MAIISIFIRSYFWANIQTYTSLLYQI